MVGRDGHGRTVAAGGRAGVRRSSGGRASAITPIRASATRASTRSRRSTSWRWYCPSGRASTETAQRVRWRISAIMKRAIAQGYRNDNPAGDAIAVALPKRPVKVRHMPALPYREVPAAIAAVHASRGWIGAMLAFEFQVLTAARAAEVRLATWDEFDLGAMMWTVPDTRMKPQREHRVPLCGRALEILREAARLSPTAATGEPSGLVFPSRRGKALSEGGISKLVKILGIAAVPHGFRPSFRDWSRRTDESPAGGHQGGAGAHGSEQGRGGLRPLGPVRAAAAPHGRLVRVPRRRARAGGDAASTMRLPFVLDHRRGHRRRARGPQCRRVAATPSSFRGRREEL